MTIARALWTRIATLSLFFFLSAQCLAAPPEVTAQTFRTRVHEFFAAHGRDSSIALMQDEGASARLRDLRWQLQDLLNKGAPLAGLEDVGLKIREDGRAIDFD